MQLSQKMRQLVGYLADTVIGDGLDESLQT
jgi:hypothetical protein